MSRAVNRFYEFGEFRLDSSEGVLRRGAEPVALPPKVFETLALLVERHGEIVSKAEMMNLLWADAFVEESNLTQNIYTLRRVLGTDESGKGFIENVPRRGYRFAAPVVIGGSDEPTLDSPTTDSGFNRNDRARGNDSLPGTRTTRRSILLGIGLAATAVALLVFAAYQFRSNRSGDRSIGSVEDVNFQKLTFTGDLTFPVLAPDGNSFAFVRGDALFVQDVNSGSEMRLNVEGHKTFGILQFSPDSSTIYFRDIVSFDVGARVFSVPRFGGLPKLVAEDVWSGFGVSPDGSQMVFARPLPNEAKDSLIIKDLASGAERSLASVDPPAEFLDNGHPAWSHDGRKIAVVIFQKLRQTTASGISVVDVATGEIDEVNCAPLWQLEQAAWLPGDRELLLVGRENRKFFQLWRVSYPGGEPKKVTNDLNIYRGVSVSKDGAKTLVRQYSIYSHLWVGERDDLVNLRQKTFGNLNRDGSTGLAWMPNGDILYVSRIMGDRDLWLYRQADDSRQQLTKQVADLHENPVVSADGKHVFFNTDRSGSNHIWRMDANGSNPTQITFGEKQTELYPQLSNDGAWLYYIKRSSPASTVWRKSLTDDRSEALTEPGKLAPDSFLSISPDGKFLAFHEAREKVTEDEGKQIFRIAVIQIERPSEPKFYSIAASRLVVRWTRDGSALEYIVNDAEGARILQQPLDDKQPTSTVVDIPKAFLHNFLWSPDGRQLVLSRGLQANDAILLTNFQP